MSFPGSHTAWCCWNMYLLKITSGQVPSPLLQPSGYHSTSTSNFFRAICLKESTVPYTGPQFQDLWNLRGERNLQKSITLSTYTLTFSDLQMEAYGWKTVSPDFCNWLFRLMTQKYQPNLFVLHVTIFVPCRVLIKGENCGYQIPHEPCPSGSVGWSIIWYTKWLPVRFPVRAHT